MVDLNKIYLYRITHINNVAHILKHGITHKNSTHANTAFVTIGDPSLITNRKDFRLDNGKELGDYIPFYFGIRMPMLYVIQKGLNNAPKIPSELIVYCVSSVAEILKTTSNFVFTDGHAVVSFSKQYIKNDLQNIENIIDRKAIKAKYWNNKDDLDFKRRKQAEFLVLGDIPVTAILGFIVYNEIAKNKLQKMMLDTPTLESPIGVKIAREAYF